jgi:hypothetical protein
VIEFEVRTSGVGESDSWFCFERDDHVDVVRLLGERQDIAAILAEEA